MHNENIKKKSLSSDGLQHITIYLKQREFSYSNPMSKSNFKR